MTTQESLEKKLTKTAFRKWLVSLKPSTKIDYADCYSCIGARFYKFVFPRKQVTYAIEHGRVLVGNERLYVHAPDWLANIVDKAFGCGEDITKTWLRNQAGLNKRKA